jgi:hypothetical protein
MNYTDSECIIAITPLFGYIFESNGFVMSCFNIIQNKIATEILNPNTITYYTQFENIRDKRQNVKELL